jgi:bifunctional enzyme CysN/CysC
MEIELTKEKMNIVTVGHVDHGKSTIIGRLLAETGSLPLGKLDRVKAYCERNSKPFEYAYLVDALKDEQAQGITIDSARVFLKNTKRDYTIHDAPGHVEFLKNMVTGASRAEGALLVIDALEGTRENSRRHGYMLSMLGIKQVAVLVNKMDLVGYRQEVFEDIVRDFSKFLSEIRISALCFIPVSGLAGDNLVGESKNMAWYHGDTVLEILERFDHEKPSIDKPFRMPVQDVYKFTEFGDSRRIIAGTILTGSIRVGDEIIFYPSGKKSRLKSIEVFNEPPKEEAAAHCATGLSLTEQIYVVRGEIAAKANEAKPRVTSRLRVSLFWLGKEPMVTEKDYLLKIGTDKVPVRIEEIGRIIDSSTLSPIDQKERIGRYETAECILKLKRAVAFDLTQEIASTGRFVIVDDHDIRGGGIILEDLKDKQVFLRDKRFLRDYKWEGSLIPQETRVEKYGQRPTLILVTGEKDSGKKPFAKRLEASLFEEGKLVYFMGIGNLLYGMDADIKWQGNGRQEHLRRLGEVAHIVLDAGLILIVTAIELTEDDLEALKTVINPDNIVTIWIGEKAIANTTYDLKISKTEDLQRAVEAAKAMLHEKGLFLNAEGTRSSFSPRKEEGRNES